MQQNKVRAREKEVFRPKKHDDFMKKEAALINKYRLKKKLTEPFALDCQKETEEERPCTSPSFSLKQILIKI